MPYRILLLVWLLAACNTQQEADLANDLPTVDLPMPTNPGYLLDSLQLDSASYYDRVLGALVGSAIGDAMGASTEMWHREEIRKQYGYIRGLTPTIRPRSPEGTWRHNLMPGATTDDTRWKYLTVKYLQENEGKLGPEPFVDFILAYYDQLMGDLQSPNGILHPDSLGDKLQRVDWITEWVRVGLAYKKGGDAFDRARDRFYGGEMSCAGQLYTPLFGLVAPTPDSAYRLAYRHAIFDLGYARDISALVSAMTHVALRTDNVDSLLNVAVFVDPHQYTDSRLIGRIAYGVADGARKAVRNVRDLPGRTPIPLPDSLALRVPRNYPGTTREWWQQDQVYRYLQRNQRAIAFHAAEIWEILVAGIAFGEGDFRRSIEFIVNYGRDNDTVAAVAGTILGARVGYSGLPIELREEIIRVNREQLGIDLVELASAIAPPVATSSTRANR